MDNVGLLTSTTTMTSLLYMLLLIQCRITTTDGKGGGGGSSAATSLVSVEASGKAEMDSKYTLTCSFPKMSNVVKLFWYKDSDIIFVHGNQQQWNVKNIKVSTGDFKVTRTHGLTFNSLQISDSATYKCYAEDNKGKSQEASLAVSLNPTAKVVKPGETVDLVCRKTIASEVLIWRKGNSIIVVNHTVIGNSSAYQLKSSNLEIKVSSSSPGTYTCYSDGVMLHTYALTMYASPEAQLSSLRGWRGIVFGAAIAVVVLGLLLLAVYIQKKDGLE